MGDFVKIAVVGAGIAGLSAAWLLSRRHHVTLIEKEPRLGGHSHTVDVTLGGRSIAVDTGFIVYNTNCYPNLMALFAHLGVPIAPTSMSFAVSFADGAYEYSGSGLSGFFGQRANLVSLSHWRMAADTLRFFREMKRLIRANPSMDLSLGEFLDAGRYSRVFIRRHILPMGAAIWSTPDREILDFPALSFARFFDNHGLLELNKTPDWRTVQSGSRAYVERMRAQLPGPVLEGHGVVRIEREADGAGPHGKGPGSVRIVTDQGFDERYDACVVASHADETLRLLTDRDAEEERLLGAFRYARNDVILHTDTRFMPKRRRVWSSWNYLGGREEDRLSVTYWMNNLQPLGDAPDIFVTLNPHVPVAPEHILRAFVYHHPLFDGAAIRAQKELWSLQGRRNTYFAGSYFGHGFHEDALQAGLAAAEAAGGVRRPWDVANESGRLHRPQDEASHDPMSQDLAHGRATVASR